MKELATIGEKELAAYAQEMTLDVGSEAEMPRLQLMQGLSELVSDGRASVGEWRDSVDGELIAKQSETFSAIVCHVSTRWMHFEDDEYTGSSPITLENANLPYEDGNKQNKKAYDFYVLLADKADETPYLLTITSTASRIARRWLTLLTKIQHQKRPVCSVVFQIGSQKQSNDKGSWFVPTVLAGRDSTQEEIEIAIDWYKQISQSQRVATGDLV